MAGLVPSRLEGTRRTQQGCTAADGNVLYGRFKRAAAVGPRHSQKNMTFFNNQILLHSHSNDTIISHHPRRPGIEQRAPTPRHDR